MGTHDHTFAVLAYRQSPYLEECILSLKQQTAASRIILATSTPSPFLRGVSEKYGIPLMINKERKGIASDWTFAYNSCTTRFATLAHQDDIYLPEYTEQCLAAAGRYPDSLIFFTDYAELAGGETGATARNVLVKKCILSLFYLHRNSAGSPFLKRLMLSFGNPIPCPSVMYGRGKIGHFEFSGAFAYNLDWEAWLRLAAREGNFTYVRKKLMLHRIHGDSELVKGSSLRRRREEDDALFTKFWPKPVAAAISRIYIFLSYGSYLKKG